MNQFIKSLSADQQMALVFALVFGVLLLGSVVYAVRSVLWDRRQRRIFRNRPSDYLVAKAQALRHPLRSLLRSSWLFALLFWFSWMLGDLAATILFGVLSFLTLREFISLSPTRLGDHRSLVVAFFVIVPLQYFLVIQEFFNLFTVFIPVYAFLLLPIISAVANDPKMFLERTAKVQWGMMVCVYGLSHVPALLLLEFPAHSATKLDTSMLLMLYVVCVVQTATASQHLFTRWLKRPPSMPAVSNSFDWLPWFLGVLVASFAGGLFAGITPLHTPAQGFALSFLACMAGTLGHLVMKAIKRDRGVTHWAGGTKSTTGAAGMLDRLDALCFAAPVFFHAVRWTFYV